jgi:predicted MFS family arabinose efflux permease
MIPALLVLFFVLLRRIPTFDRLQEHRAAGGLSALRPYAKPLTLLYLIVVLRTLTAMSFSTFLPVLLTRRGQSLAQAGTVVSIYLIAVGLGGFIGGPSADRFGPRRVIALSLVFGTFLMTPAAPRRAASSRVAMGGVPAAVQRVGQCHVWCEHRTNQARRCRRS